MICIIRNPLLWLDISAYGGGVFVRLFFERWCSPNYFFRNSSENVRIRKRFQILIELKVYRFRAFWLDKDAVTCFFFIRS